MNPATTTSAERPADAQAVPPRRRAAGIDVSRHAIWLGFALAVLILSLVLHVRGEEQVIIPLLNEPLPGTCTFRRLFGFGCPGCGLTRCFISLAHGRLADAWHFNPAGFLVFAFVLAQVPYRGLQLWRLATGRASWEPYRATAWIVTLGAVVLLGQWVIRLVWHQLV